MCSKTKYKTPETKKENNSKNRIVGKPDSKICKVLQADVEPFK